MAPEAGQTLYQYRLIEKIGQGGMGVVWKALDTTLDREVAIKFLPEGFAVDQDRLARFEREAKLLASLNHPFIATVYGLHEQDGAPFIAMELVPGETLSDRVARGPLPVDDALELARQVADALEAAHERDVIHRDLKPANIRVTPDGTAKVLDFGLAKAAPGPAGGDPSLSPTVTSGGTQAGIILGTAAYMSPEQARGKPLDRRTDIWSFGCVLYECLTGRKAFPGETVSDTLARILEREPDWAALPGKIPPSIGRLLRRCLQKDPRRRLRDAGEARVAIEELGTEPAAADEAPLERSRFRALPWALAALIALGGIAVGWMARRPVPVPPRPPARLAITLPQDHLLGVADTTALAISPDGSRVVYAAASPPGSVPRLYLRELDRFEPVPLSGTEGALGPFFSPDGEWLGYFADGKLNKIAVEGGAPLEICRVVQVVPGASWGRDGTILFSDSPDGGLLRVPAAGGTPETFTTPAYADGEHSHGWPQHLPDGEHVLFTTRRNDGTSIALLSLRSGEWTVLAEGVGGARYLPAGYLVYARMEGLVAARLDPGRPDTMGEPVLVVEDVYTIPFMKGTGLAAFDLSPTGVLVYVGGGAEAGENRLVWVDRNGRTRPAFDEPGGYEWPNISPDGERVAVNNRTRDGKIGIWLLDLERGSRSRLTHAGNDIIPVWTPDSERIAFGSTRGASRVCNLYWKPADGSRDATLLDQSDHPRFAGSWSPDGKLLAFVEWHPRTMRDIWLLDAQDPGESTPILQTEYDEFSPLFSPDGRWLAYNSNESGRYEIYVESFPRGRGRWLVSAGGGTEPVWSADGSELFYRKGEAMFVVPVRFTPTFSAGAPQRLFERSLKRGIYDSLSYDVSPDGREFLMIERQLELVPNQLHVVLDWDEELRRRLPASPD